MMLTCRAAQERMTSPPSSKSPSHLLRSSPAIIDLDQLSNRVQKMQNQEAVLRGERKVAIRSLDASRLS